MHHRITTTDELGNESGIILRSRLTLGLEAKFREEYRQAFVDDLAPTTFTTSLLLLTAYATGWYGALFPMPFSEHALLDFDSKSPLMREAMEWCYQRFFSEPTAPEQPTTATTEDAHYTSIVRRWERKLRDENANVRAGHYDQVVSLMARFGWTERQVLEDNSPEIISELCARLEAEANIAKDGKKKRGNENSTFINMWDRVKALAKAGGTNGSERQS